ncbi:MAG: hypothetical protein K9K75_06260 [Deltaproteobacteria bacterium]|nr:hypothetical protein [Deltaproteobacteria bacterium]
MKEPSNDATSHWMRPIITLIGAFAGAIFQYYLGPSQPVQPVTITILDSQGIKVEEVPVQIPNHEKNINIELSKSAINTIVKGRDSKTPESNKHQDEKHQGQPQFRDIVSQSQIPVTFRHPDQETQVAIMSKHPDEEIQVPVISANPTR